MAKIRDDLVGVVHPLGADGMAASLTLSAGDTVPAGFTVGDHLLAPAAKSAGKTPAGKGAAKAKPDEKPAGGPEEGSEEGSADKGSAPADTKTAE